MHRGRRSEFSRKFTHLESSSFPNSIRFLAALHHSSLVNELPGTRQHELLLFATRSAQTLIISLFSAKVWFQNRRSKERRMKHMGMHNARRHFMRNPRRAMRSLRPGQPHDGIEDSGDMGQHFGYFSGKRGQFEVMFTSASANSTLNSIISLLMTSCYIHKSFDLKSLQSQLNNLMSISCNNQLFLSTRQFSIEWLISGDLIKNALKLAS